MKQIKISYWLKGMTVVLGIMGLLAFSGLTWYAFTLKKEMPESAQWQFIFFTWYTAVLCYLILFQFWKVCTEIGKDNSFSMENARAFHIMGLCAIAEITGEAGRIIWLGVTGLAEPAKVLAVVVKMILAAMFLLLCEALSRLIQYAYDVKQENDLTI